MAYDPALLAQLKGALVAALEQVPGVEGRVSVDISSPVLGDQAVTVTVPPDTTATGR